MAASEQELLGTGLDERFLNTYRLAYATDPPMTDIAGRKKLAAQLGLTEPTIYRQLRRVEAKLDDPAALEAFEPTSSTFDQRSPEKCAQAIIELSSPGASVRKTARSLGIAQETAAKIRDQLDGELLPLKRVIEDVKLEDLTKRFGTLARDAIDAVTPEKLAKANAQQLAIIAGIATEKWQLLRGQPTSRMEIGDRRKMDELLNVILKEAKRRNIEIDVTPEGGVVAKKSPFKNAMDKRVRKQLDSGDPVETLRPA